jgi:hypothetical protein
MQKQLEKLMSLVSVDQTALDTLATNLEAVKTALSAEIANLQAEVAAGNLPAASLTGLNQALTDLQALAPPAPAP